MDKTVKDEEVKVEECIDCSIVNCDFSFNKTDKTMLTLSNCVRCTVSKCKFHDKDTKGLFIKIVGDKTKDNVIEDCEFWNHTFNKENGGEPMRIGGSEFSGCKFNTIIRNCHFHDLKSDVETISIKSCGNVIENNKHEDCKSSITIRHGGFNKIRNNLFIGSGGIRVFGDGNEITGNYHKNNHSTKFPPLIVSNGSVEKDPNFDEEGNPIGKKGSSHAAYARVKNNLIEGNTYDNCDGICIMWGRKKKDNQKLPPIKGSIIKDNIIVDDDDTDSIFLVCSGEAKLEDSRCEANQLFGRNAKRGDILEQAIKILDARPEIKLPAVGRAMREAMAAAAPTRFAEEERRFTELT